MCADLNAFDVLPVGVLVTVGSDHRLIYSNYAYQEMVGHREHGAPIREALGDVCVDGDFTLFDRALETGEAVTVDEIPFEYGEPGRRRFASVGMSKIMWDGEEGLLIVVQEVTQRIASERPPSSVAGQQQRFLQRYRSLVQLQTDAVWVSDPMGRVREPSAGWQRLTGQPWEEYRGDGWLNAVYPDDREPAIEVWARAVEQRDNLNQVYRVRTSGGGYRHVRVRGMPIIEGGEIVEWVGAIADIEQEWQEEQHRLLLDQVAAVTVNLADLDEVLRALAEVIVPNLADGCGIYVLPEFEDQPISMPFMATPMAIIVPAGARPFPRQEVFDSNSDLVTAVRTRRPIARMYPEGNPPPGSVPLTINGDLVAEVNSSTMVPVVVDGVVAAVVHAVVVGDREPLSVADIELLGRMLDHAHPHLSNAMRFQRTQGVALALQKYLLPDPPRVPDLEITARYSASATAAEIGGDWYDSFVLPDGSMVLTIGDMAGHDLTAAVTMSQVRNALRGLAIDRREPPGDILRRLNIATETLYPEDTGTCILARLENPDNRAWRLHYSVAGHPPPLLVTQDGEAHYLEDAVNPLLGVGYDMPRASTVATLPPRSTLLLYTDGLVEVPGEHLDLGLERLRRAASSLARAPLDAFCDELLSRLPMPRKDDIAVIAVRLPPSCPGTDSVTAAVCPG
ncbi:SpoIIE family protein phosphatase [Nonomuraea terrae]|uniref:SpoIIE family protein phosphatase n=1 Tax=Nonomuraea terrae TaxID=2530383 RepID=UPI001FE31273|nr:SpoIIE family protein phosphatase [Nonomuraea terrae]